jgi:hypothetical protein
LLFNQQKYVSTPPALVKRQDLKGDSESSLKAIDSGLMATSLLMVFHIIVGDGLID